MTDTACRRAGGDDCPTITEVDSFFEDEGNNKKLIRAVSAGIDADSDKMMKLTMSSQPCGKPMLAVCATSLRPVKSVICLLNIDKHKDINAEVSHDDTTSVSQKRYRSLVAEWKSLSLESKIEQSLMLTLIFAILFVCLAIFGQFCLHIVGK